MHAYPHHSRVISALGRWTVGPVLLLTVLSSCLGTALGTPANCTQDASQPACAGYTYSTKLAFADVTKICTQQPHLSACSLFRLCNDNHLDPDLIGKAPQTCSPMQLLASLCRFDSMARNLPACSNYRALCLSPNTVVTQCKRTCKTGKYLVPTAATASLSRLMCEKNPTSTICRKCDWPPSRLPKCDPLSVYGALCVEDPERDECGLWDKMCRADGSLYVCRAQAAIGRPGPMRPPKYMLASQGADVGQPNSPQRSSSARTAVGPGLRAVAGAAVAAVVLGLVEVLMQ